jgi:methionine-rich copper-binding protein CopC
MASPHAAGAAALLLSQNPSLPPAQVGAALTSNATAGVIAGATSGTPNRLLFAGTVAPAPAPAAPAPTVTAVTPKADATTVAAGTNVAATFSADVQGVSSGTFVLKTAAGSSIQATVAYNATTRTATLDPTASLAADTRYTATLVGGTSAIRGSTGTPLDSTSWSFLTGPAPVLTSTTPGSNALLVRRTNNISVTFSEAVQGVTGASFTVTNAATGALVPASVYRNGTTNQWILDPQQSLAAKTKYTVTVTGGSAAVRDLAGNPFTGWSWQFTTGSF